MNDTAKLLSSLRWFAISAKSEKDGDGRSWREVTAGRRAIRSRAGGLDRARYVEALRQLLIAGEARVEIAEDGTTRILVSYPTTGLPVEEL